MKVLPLYESPELRGVTGQTIRPGGFALTGRAVELCNLTGGAAVLDIGCGLGATVNRLETMYGLKALGLDVSICLLREGRSIHSSSFLMAGLAEQLPLREKSIECVFCECVLSLLDNPERALAEAGQTLKPGGWLVITDVYARRPEGFSILQHLPLNSCLKGARPRREIIRLVEGAGFQLVLWEDHSVLLKHLAAKIVFEFGSMKEFWARFAPDCAVQDLTCGLEQTRPGYYLMTAQKKGGLDE